MADTEINRLSLSISNIYRVVSRVNSDRDENAFSKGKDDVTLANTQGKIEAVVRRNPQMAEAALDQVEKEFALRGITNVDLGEKGFNIYALPESVRYAIWYAFKDTELCANIGTEDTKTKVYYQYKFDNPNPIDAIASWPRIGGPYKHVSVNSNLSLEYTPWGTTTGNHGWLGHLLKPENINSIKIRDLGLTVRMPDKWGIFADTYLSLTGDLENTSYNSTGQMGDIKYTDPENNVPVINRDPMFLGSDSTIDIKSELVFPNPFMYFCFNDKTRFMSFKYTQYFNENKRGDAVTPLAPGKREDGYRGEWYFDMTGGAGGAVGFALDYYSSWGNEQNLPGDNGCFGYHSYGGGWRVNYNGEVGPVYLGVNVADDEGNRYQDTVGGIMSWTGRGGLPLLPAIGSGQKDIPGDWNMYREQNRSAKLSIGVTSWKVKAINAYPVINIEADTSSVGGREHSDRYTLGVNLGEFGASISRATNFIPRDGSSHLVPLSTYLWNIKLPVDVAYLVSSHCGEKEPRLSAGAVLNVGGSIQYQPSEGISSNSGLYAYITYFFRTGTGSDRGKKALKATQSPGSQMVNDRNPNINEQKVLRDKEKDSKHVKDKNLNSDWTDKNVPALEKAKPAADTKEGTK